MWGERPFLGPAFNNRLRVYLSEAKLGPVKRLTISGSNFLTPLAFWVVLRRRWPNIWVGGVAIWPGITRASLR